MRSHAESSSGLLVGIKVILGDMWWLTLVEVFLKWMDRLQQRTDMNGEYVGEDERKKYITINFIR
jgi:hypothetical protein